MCAAALPVALVVEDDQLLRYVIASALRHDGWIVLETGSGEGALAYLDAGERIDLVFTDVQLASIVNGWDVAEAFRMFSPAVPIIYASGNAADRSRQVVGSRFFDKPYDMAAVVRTCRRYV
jgi:CheY-like chemotaxis protein